MKTRGYTFGGCALGVLAAVGALTACSSDAPRPAPRGPLPAPQQSRTVEPGTPDAAPVQPPSVASANTADPDSVARVVLATMYTIDATRERSFSDALRRAAPLLAPGYAAAVSAAPTPAPDAQWQQWQQHQAYTTVTLTASPEDRPADSATTAYRGYVLDDTAIGRDGWRGAPQHTVALVALTHTGHGWAVTQIDFR